MDCLTPEVPELLGAATFRFSPDAEVTARRAMDEDFRPFLVVEFTEPGRVPIRFALPVELGTQVWRELGLVVSQNGTEAKSE